MDQLTASGAVAFLSSLQIIAFESKPFTATALGEKTLWVARGYCATEGCGVAIKSPRGLTVYGDPRGRDLIAAWRGALIIARLDRIDRDALSMAYSAGRREIYSTLGGSAVNALELDTGSYEEIMSRPVPEEVVQAILCNQEVEGIAPRPDAHAIAGEVIAGTIEWRTEFESFGIERPVTFS